MHWYAAARYACLLRKQQQQQRAKEGEEGEENDGAEPASDLPARGNRMLRPELGGMPALAIQLHRWHRGLDPEHSNWATEVQFALPVVQAWVCLNPSFHLQDAVQQAAANARAADDAASSLGLLSAAELVSELLQATGAHVSDAEPLPEARPLARRPSVAGSARVLEEPPAPGAGLLLHPAAANADASCAANDDTMEVLASGRVAPAGALLQAGPPVPKVRIKLRVRAPDDSASPARLPTQAAAAEPQASAQARVSARRIAAGNLTPACPQWVVRCPCGAGGTNYDDGFRMVECTSCGVWQHTDCVGVVGEPDPQFRCSQCASQVRCGGGRAVVHLPYWAAPQARSPQTSDVEDSDASEMDVVAARFVAQGRQRKRTARLKPRAGPDEAAPDAYMPHDDLSGLSGSDTASPVAKRRRVGQTTRGGVAARSRRGGAKRSAARKPSLKEKLEKMQRGQRRPWRPW